MILWARISLAPITVVSGMIVAPEEDVRDVMGTPLHLWVEKCLVLLGAKWS